jgi:tRNA A-37 threonylcarbamoyl transferase component Bud32
MTTDAIIKDEPKCLIRSESLADGTRAVLKMYRHRGAAGALREALFGCRVRREYTVLDRLARGGIPCTPPLFWKRGCSRENGFYETLATREIPGALALDTLWASGRKPAGRIAWEALFEIVARMHGCGVFHGALSPKNILIVSTASLPAAFFLVDAARAKLFSKSILGRKIAGYDLLQLVLKLERLLGPGACRPYLARYGLDGPAIAALYAEAAPYGALRRRDKILQARLSINIQRAAWAARWIA